MGRDWESRFSLIFGGHFFHVVDDDKFERRLAGFQPESKLLYGRENRTTGRIRSVHGPARFATTAWGGNSDACRSCRVEQSIRREIHSNLIIAFQFRHINNGTIDKSCQHLGECGHRDLAHLEMHLPVGARSDLRCTGLRRNHGSSPTACLDAEFVARADSDSRSCGIDWRLIRLCGLPQLRTAFTYHQTVDRVIAILAMYFQLEAFL